MFCACAVQRVSQARAVLHSVSRGSLSGALFPFPPIRGDYSVSAVPYVSLLTRFPDNQVPSPSHDHPTVRQQAAECIQRLFKGLIAGRNGYGAVR